MIQNVTIVSEPKDLNGMTVEEFLVYAARVSSPKSAEEGKSPERLIAYLIRNHHWSPFEMVSVTMKIETTRDISRQIIRHRSFCFQEFSQRYADVTELGDPVYRECRLQHPTNRQSSLPCDDAGLKLEWAEAQGDVWRNAMRSYNVAVSRGIAKEQARVLLPEGLTPTTIYMAGNLRSWMHYCGLRSGNGTQAEHADIAIQARQILADRYPMVFVAMESKAKRSTPDAHDSGKPVGRV